MQVKVKVDSMDTKLEFSIQTDTKGKQLFDMVTVVLNIKEHWWFGLQYTRERDKSHGWVRLADKVSNTLYLGIINVLGHGLVKCGK